MKKRLVYSLLGIALLSLLAGPAFAHDKHGQKGAAMAEHGAAAMKMKMMDDKGLSCMSKSSSLAQRLDKMTCMLTGKMPMKPGMHAMMKKMFFLDRIEELGLQKTQVKQLKDIHAACRRDNLRTAVEVKISRFELEDLLEGDWTLKAAEQLIRKIAQLEGEMKVRHLAATKDAFAVLTDEQANRLLTEDSAESLFDE